MHVNGSAFVTTIFVRIAEYPQNQKAKCYRQSFRIDNTAVLQIITIHCDNEFQPTMIAAHANQKYIIQQHCELQQFTAIMNSSPL
jgi:hypothetical protein